MAQADVARFQLRRVNPFQGLMIDAATWRDAHEYHRNQMRLHHLALHGWGIVQGLEVRVEGSDNVVAVEPGIAVDPTGNFVVVTQRYTHRIQTRGRQTVYLLLQFSEVPTGPAPPGGNGASQGGQPGGQATRILEAYRIQQRDDLPDEPYVELLRVDFDPAGGPLAPARDAENPGRNELDTRFRTAVGTAPAMPVALPPMPAGPAVEAPPPAVPAAPIAPVAEMPPPEPPPPPPPPAPLPEPAAPAAFTPPPFEPAPPPFEPAPPPFEPASFASAPSFPSAPPAPVAPPPLVFAVAAHGSAGGNRHDDGVRYLAREVGRVAGREVTVRDGAPLSDLDGVDFLYMTGHARLSLGPDEMEGLRRVLDRGGVVLGEGCASGPSGDAGAREFALSFADLAGRVGRQLGRVERGDPLLVAQHVFSGPPAGARANMMVLESEGMVYSDADYGCAWQGGTQERPLPRGPIRDAMEFGVNLVLYRRDGR